MPETFEPPRERPSSIEYERPFVTWINMESACGCVTWRGRPRNCRHRRRVEADNIQRAIDRENVAALTDDDVAWLNRNGWNGHA